MIKRLLHIYLKLLVPGVVVVMAINLIYLNFANQWTDIPIIEIAELIFLGGMITLGCYDFWNRCKEWLE